MPAVPPIPSPTTRIRARANLVCPRHPSDPLPMTRKAPASTAETWKASPYFLLCSFPITPPFCQVRVNRAVYRKEAKVKVRLMEEQWAHLEARGPASPVDTRPAQAHNRGGAASAASRSLPTSSYCWRRLLPLRCRCCTGGRRLVGREALVAVGRPLRQACLAVGRLRVSGCGGLWVTQ